MAILWKEVYDIPVMRELEIGDTAILRKISKGRTSMLIKNKVFQKKGIPESWKCKMVVRKENLGASLGDIISVSIFASDNERFIRALSEDRPFQFSVQGKGEPRMLGTSDGHYRVATVYGNIEAGTKENAVVFNTGGEGCFGNFLESSSPRGILLTIDIPVTVSMTEKVIRKNLAVIFQCDTLFERGTR